jgi:DNA-binding transcriptional LysR family regulator
MSQGARFILTEALAAVGRASDSYIGKLRVTVPADFPAQIVAAAIAEFRGGHPAVQFEMLLTNDVLDLVSENIDIALRTGASNPQESPVRRAIDMDFSLYASAEYLKINGEPAAIEAVSALIGPRRPALRRLLSRALRRVSNYPKSQRRASCWCANSFCYIKASGCYHNHSAGSNLHQEPSFPFYRSCSPDRHGSILLFPRGPTSARR